MGENVVNAVKKINFYATVAPLLREDWIYSTIRQKFIVRSDRFDNCELEFIDPDFLYTPNVTAVIGFMSNYGYDIFYVFHNAISKMNNIFFVRTNLDYVIRETLKCEFNGTENSLYHIIRDETTSRSEAFKEYPNITQKMLSRTIALAIVKYIIDNECFKLILLKEFMYPLRMQDIYPIIFEFLIIGFSIS